MPGVPRCTWWSGGDAPTLASASGIVDAGSRVRRWLPNQGRAAPRYRSRGSPAPPGRPQASRPPAPAGVAAVAGVAAAGTVPVAAATAAAAAVAAGTPLGHY